MNKTRGLIAVAVSIFVILFLIGMLRGNMFLVILGRSAAGAVVFTFLISAAYIVMSKIINDLPADETPGRGKNTARERPGDSLDIMIDGDENPYIENETAGDDTAFSEINSETAAGYEDFASAASDGFVEEVEEESLGDIGFLDQSEGESEIVEVMNDNSDINEGFGNGSLPSIDKQSVAFNSTNARSGSGSGSDALNILGDNIDAGSMAKAIKTVLTRDQKG